MSPPMLLVHSPLVGPGTMAPLATSMRERSFEVIVPDLTGVADAPAPRWEWLVAAVRDAANGIDSPITVAGHSGAGAFLPAIGAVLGARRGPLVFLDAVVPPADGPHVTSSAMRDVLDGLTADGTLPRWLDWWPAETVEELLPDPAARQRLLGEMPQLPRAFYDETIPTPPGWTRWPCGYLQLSPAYDDDSTRAAASGWPVSSLDSSHLALFTEPEVVAARVDELLDTLGG